VEDFPQARLNFAVLTIEKFDDGRPALGKLRKKMLKKVV